MAQFKKGSKEAKAFMASIRAKKATAKKAVPRAGYAPERYSDLKEITKGTRKIMKKQGLPRSKANVKAGLDYFTKKSSSAKVAGNLGNLEAIPYGEIFSTTFQLYLVKFENIGTQLFACTAIGLKAARLFQDGKNEKMIVYSINTNGVPKFKKLTVTELNKILSSR